jgi:hypothetical protein
MVMGVVSKVLIRKITLEICGPALTVCLSHNPPQPVRASFLPVPDVLRPGIRQPGAAKVDQRSRHRHGVDRSGQALAEWRRGKLQRQIPRERTFIPGDQATFASRKR